MKLPWTQLIEHLKQQLADERAMHERELERALAENRRLGDECERLRLTLGQPSRVAEPPPEPKKPRDLDEMPEFSGTNWDRVRQREMWLQTPAGRRWEQRQLATIKDFVKPSGDSMDMLKKEKADA